MHHLIVAATSYAAIKLKKTKKKSYKIGKRIVRRTRKSVIQVHNELGRDVFRRAYRMHLETFLNLYSIVKEDLFQVMKYNDNCRRGPNGRIHPSVILACALRVFSGGDSYDLITTFGISKTMIHYSVDIVIETICKCEALKVEFPTSHTDQLRIAKGFEEKSVPKFKKCVGAVDGMLVWISKPTEEECKKVGVGSAKFFCGRKKKFKMLF